jgi:hypothetical protein
MAKKSSTIRISSDFWKGLILGIIIAAAGIFIYVKFFSSQHFPPTNKLIGNPASLEQPAERRGLE